MPPTDAEPVCMEISICEVVVCACVNYSSNQLCTNDAVTKQTSG